MTFVSEIVTCIDEREITDIEQVFLVMQDNYNEFKSIIDDKKSTVQMQELMPIGIIDLI